MFKLNLLPSHNFLLLIFSFSLINFLLLPTLCSRAENIPLPSDAPLELSLLNKPNGIVITADIIAPQGLTIPSLWWAKQTSEKKLLDNWIAYPASQQEPPRVDLIVNQQVWSLLDYLERYKFVNQMGTVARNFGYNIRIFNYQKERLATYTCNLSVNPDSCNIQMSVQNRLGLSQKSEL